jgi:flagella basal body P-ring formation protein FlgA
VQLFRVFLSAALCAGLPALAATAPLTLVLKEQATISGTAVTLADLAELPPAAAPLGRIALAAAPMPAYPLRLTRQDVQALLRKYGAGGEVAWQGAQQVAVHRQVQSVPGSTLEESALDAVRPLVQASGAQPRLLSRPDALAAPAGALRIQARALSNTDGLPMGGETVVWLDVHVDGRLVRAVRVPVAFSLPGVVHRARRAVRAGEQLRADDWEAVAVDFAPPQAWRGDVRQLEGARAAAPLRQGQMLLKESLMQSGAVQAGDPVRIQLQDGAIRIESMGQAATSGRDGESIAVRVASAHALLKARVRDGQAVLE